MLVEHSKFHSLDRKSSGFACLIVVSFGPSAIDIRRPMPQTVQTIKPLFSCSYQGQVQHAMRVGSGDSQFKK